MSEGKVLDMHGKPAVHVKKFDHANGGKRTPAEVHREIGLRGHTCSFCGDPAAMKAMVYADADEFMRREPEAFMELVRQVGGDPAFDSRWGRIVRIQDVYGCDACKQSLRQSMAKKPDWCFVDFDEMGLDSSHPFQIQVK